MFVLHIDLPVNDGVGEGLEQTFATQFLPAIASQHGFQQTQLLRSIESEANYCLTIAFEDQICQQRWVASDVHERVWSAMQSHCADIRVRKYQTI